MKIVKAVVHGITTDFKGQILQITPEGITVSDEVAAGLHEQFGFQGISITDAPEVAQAEAGETVAAPVEVAAASTDVAVAPVEATEVVAATNEPVEAEVAPVVAPEAEANQADAAEGAVAPEVATA